MLPGVLLRASDSHLFRALIPWISPGASTVRDLWLCPADACNPLNLLSTDRTLKAGAPAWLSSPGMHFLTQGRPYQLRWLCLKVGLCYVQGHFLFSVHGLICPAQPCSTSWTCWPDEFSGGVEQPGVQEVRQRPGSWAAEKGPKLNIWDGQAWQRCTWQGKGHSLWHFTIDVKKQHLPFDGIQDLIMGLCH